MLKFAYIFPGQGAQYVGMGQDYYNRYPQAKEIFERANSVLGFDLTKLIFEGPQDELNRTLNCQVAVFVVSIACLRALENYHPAIDVKYTAGLSLGEYTALVAAEAIDFEEGLKLVHKRAQYMEEAAQENPGAMLCVIGLALDKAQHICEKAGVEIANLNCPGQIVISGKVSGLKKAEELAQEAGAKKIIPLKVSGAFHSSLMSPAAKKLSVVLEKTEIRPPKIAVLSNVTAGEQSSPQEIKDNLARQVTSRTLWEDSIRFIAARGVKNFLEIGPGRVLKGLLRKIDSELKVYSIETVEDLEQFRKERAICC
ncbi:MAG: ACP S-malonyltransferase [Candidatus Omnitrophota bacterium]|nr:MAG: ACP S-malonyltransferase [Candidatus Omnitrophota bacterium]